MSQTALVLMLLGVLVAIIGWLMGGSNPARGVRSATDSLNDSARAQLAARGVNTGAFGAWLGRYRVLVRTLVAVLAALWLFAMRPISIGDILLVLIVALLVGWILELLQRREDVDEVEVEVSDDLDAAVGDQADTLVIDDADTLVLADADTLVIEGAAPKSKPKAKP